MVQLAAKAGTEILEHRHMRTEHAPCPLTSQPQGGPLPSHLVLQLPAAPAQVLLLLHLFAEEIVLPRLEGQAEKKQEDKTEREMNRCRQDLDETQR